ncbi:MAG: hypothetical protein PHD97_12615, partial [Bacteroidales bacterium]|nr:hypothetical protein [Bacteroidales bacterium]
TAGKRIMDMLNKRKICSSEMFYTETIEDAVKISKDNTKEDTICLLSPAAASYGMFKNFEDRGEQFIKLVKS